jgi:putative membrane protein
VTVLGATAAPDYFRFVPHPEVWLLVLSVIGLYAWAGKVIGPKVLPAGTRPYTRRQIGCFIGGVLLLEVASDWPMHDIGENYLFLVHMTQHLILSMAMPPLMLLATPEWLARLSLGDGRAKRIVHRLARPVLACAMFNAYVLFTHWPYIVDHASSNGAWFHYSLHTGLVGLALLLWLPICGPLPELRISMPAQMIYLFVTSIVPTVPGAWMTFANGALYKVYDTPNRLWGISVTSDQQAAGLIMKLVGGTYLWVLITVIFFRWSARHADADIHGIVPSERDVLTWDTVKAELDRTEPHAPVER